MSKIIGLAAVLVLMIRFTGLDVGFMAAGSLLLITLGFMLRWLGRPSAPPA